ncbi:unnamed protein product [Plutella xylostella]|uniref:Ubiquitin-protein ligase E3C n=1 Tax=Plutella xylostella TaxID=51655 RepID=A0A8S4G565_PLUXY|nr:unnamed protein product [Plutella xylostella]
MYSFEGDFRRKPQQNLAGASAQRSTDRNALILQTQQQRQKREEHRRRLNSTIKIQAYVRSYMTRKYYKQIEREKFDSEFPQEDTDDDVFVSNLVARILYFYDDGQDVPRLISISQLLLKRWKRVFHSGGSAVQIRRLLALHLRLLRETSDLPLAVPLRMFEVFTSTVSLETALSPEDASTTIGHTLHYLVKRGYFSDLRNLMCRRTPPLLGPSANPPTPLCAALLELIMRPVHLVGKVPIPGYDGCMLRTSANPPTPLCAALLELMLRPVHLVGKVPIPGYDGCMLRTSANPPTPLCAALLELMLRPVHLVGKVPIPGYDGCMLRTSANPPTPLCAALLELMLRPVHLVGKVPIPGYDDTVMTEFTASFLCTAYPEPVEMFVIPSIVQDVNHRFPFLALVQCLQDDTKFAQRRLINDSWLLHSVLTLEPQQFVNEIRSLNSTKLPNNPYVLDYLKVVVKLTVNVCNKQINYEFEDSLYTQDTSADKDDDDSDTDSEPDLISLKEQMLLTRSIEMLNEPERCIMSACSQITDTDLSDEFLDSMSEICHNLLLSHRFALHKYRLLYTLAFKPVFLRGLWRFLSNMSHESSFGGTATPLLSALSRGMGSDYSVIGVHRLLAPLAVFCALFSLLIGTLHDTEFVRDTDFEGDEKMSVPQSPSATHAFSLSALGGLCRTLRQVCLGLVELACPERGASDSRATHAQPNKKPAWPHLFKVCLGLVELACPERGASDSRATHAQPNKKPAWPHLFKVCLGLVELACPERGASDSRATHAQPNNKPAWPHLFKVCLGLVELACPERGASDSRATHAQPNKKPAWPHLFKVCTHLLRALYVRDSRLQFCSQRGSPANCGGCGGAGAAWTVPGAVPDGPQAVLILAGTHARPNPRLLRQDQYRSSQLARFSRGLRGLRGRGGGVDRPGGCGGCGGAVPDGPQAVLILAGTHARPNPWLLRQDQYRSAQLGNEVPPGAAWTVPGAVPDGPQAVLILAGTHARPNPRLLRQDQYRSSQLEDGPPLTVKELRTVTILREIPFVVPFATRVQILQGLLNREKQESWYEMSNFNEGPMINISVRRSHLYEDAFDKLSPDNEPNMKLKLRVQLVNQAGADEAGVDGGGLFREFLSELLKSAFDPNRGLFRLTRDNMLYPNPGVHLLYDDFPMHYFFVGRMLGKAIYENLLVELPLAEFFLAKLCCRREPDVHALASLDPGLYRGLLLLKTHRRDDVPDLGLDFTIVSDELGEQRIDELKPGGANIPVTAENRIEYIHLVADYKLNRAIRAQCHAFKRGLTSVVSADWLRMFSCRELQLLIAGAETAVDINDLRAHTMYTGGFSDEHPTVKAFWKVVESFTDDQRRQLLKFVTSCSRPPLLGFKDLQPPFCIQNAGPSDRLPTSSTCMNLLKLPDFQSEAALAERLLYAVQAGAGFELS